MAFRILLTEEIDGAGRRYLLDRGYEIKAGTGIAEDTVAREAAGCDGILTRNAVITERILRSSDRLKVVAMHGVGVDNIDVAAATRLGIQVVNAAGSNSLAVAEFTIGLMLDLSRNIFLYDRGLRAGNWNVRRTLGSDLQGKTLGIVGMGSIGRIVAKKAADGFGMDVVGFRRRIAAEPAGPARLTADLDEVLRQADFVSLHVPSTPATRRMIGGRELSLMKRGSFLINTARGDVVDTAALARALKSGHLAGAAVDVFEGEIPGAENPLLHLDNVIATPHAAAFTRESVARMALYAARGIDEVLSGRAPTHPVNRVEASFPAGRESA